MFTCLVRSIHHMICTKKFIISEFMNTEIHLMVTSIFSFFPECFLPYQGQYPPVEPHLSCCLQMQSATFCSFVKNYEEELGPILDYVYCCFHFLLHNIY